MALTVAIVAGSKRIEGNKRVREVDITFDSSYPDNGEAITAVDCGLKTIQGLNPHGPAVKSDGSVAVLVSYDATNSKMLAFWQTDPAAVGGAAVPFPEVADTTSLATYAVRATVIGL